MPNTNVLNSIEFRDLFQANMTKKPLAVFTQFVGHDQHSILGNNPFVACQLLYPSAAVTKWALI